MMQPSADMTDEQYLKWVAWMYEQQEEKEVSEDIIDFDFDEHIHELLK